MMKVVHVTWEDPCFASSGWMTRSDFLAWAKSENSISDSVGIMAFESDDYIVLIQSIGVNQVADGIKINKASIKNIKELATIPLSLSID